MVPACPACCGCKHENFLRRKITVHFKLNLKTDSLNRKMFFKFGKRIERLHSCCKQGRRIYNVCICKQCVCLYKHHLRCKMLVGNTQTLELHRADAGYMLSQSSNQLLPQRIQSGSGIRIHALVQAASGVPEGRAFALHIIGKGGVLQRQSRSEEHTSELQSPS